MGNLGYLFQAKDYFKEGICETDIKDIVKEIITFEVDSSKNINGEVVSKQRSEELLNLGFTNSKSPHIGEICSFSMETTYPGLVVGMSNPRMYFQDSNEAIKTGFGFDYVTGLPFLPGSSVKGMLRDSVLKYEEDIVSWIEKETSLKKVEVKELVLQLFGPEHGENDNYQKDRDGETPNKEKKSDYSNIYQRDVFLDAVINSDRGTILKEDYITPHESKFTDPKPIKIMALKPGVSIQFQFLIRSHCILGLDPDLRLKLYKGLLRDMGIGAKTNVGYGYLKELDEK